MKRTIAIAVALAAFALPTGASATEPIQVVAEQRLSPRLIEYTLRTPALTTETVVRVLVPRDYTPGGAKRYPVLYLLHGCCDVDVRGSQAWTTHGEAERATEGLDLIVVMPDGGRGGEYTNWFNNGLGGNPRWEDYHVGQLIPWVDGQFRTRASREGRVLAGLSMGGFGTMKYAARHPDLFVAAASYSGIVDSNVSPETFLVLPLLDGGPPGSVFGLRQTEEVRWRGNNPWDLAENLRGLHLELRSGNGEPGGPYDGDSTSSDGLESGAHDQTVSLHERFVALGVPHVWDDYGPGTHTWPYWARDLRLTLSGFMRVLADPPPPPARVTYSAIEPEYEVFGWHVKLDRPELEFSRLSDAASGGFTLAGSGTAAVTTPALYTPGARYAVTTGTQRSTIAADDAGRLSVSVPLGPGNAMQQYRPGAETTVSTARVRIEPVCERRTRRAATRRSSACVRSAR